MAKTQTKIFLTGWRDTTITFIVLYFALLILNVLIDGFVGAFIPLPVVGYLTAINLALYVWWWQRGTTVSSAASTKV